jgi:hypothetical protein
MPNSPRRGSRLTLDCSCEGRVIDWVLPLWGDRIFVVQLLGKGDRCRVARHRSGRRVSVRLRKRDGRRIYVDMLK